MSSQTDRQTDRQGDIEVLSLATKRPKQFAALQGTKEKPQNILGAREKDGGARVKGWQQDQWLISILFPPISRDFVLDLFKREGKKK